MSGLVGLEKYDDFTRAGTSTYSHALRLGRGRWRIEVMLGAIWIRLGPVAFSCGFEWADEGD